MELVVIFPAVLLVIFAVVQGALYYFASSSALAAAQEGARTAAGENSSAAAGQQAAGAFSARVAGNMLQTPGVVASRTATTATVTVSGHSLSVLPGFAGIGISQTASVPVERLTGG
nr:TadE/TadG family type IV pilus assembly protein [Kineosporia corallincola]